MIAPIDKISPIAPKYCVVFTITIERVVVGSAIN